MGFFLCVSDDTPWIVDAEVAFVLQPERMRLAKPGRGIRLEERGDGMATQSDVLSTEFEQFASELVNNGRYSTTAEVMQAAMEALRREECDDDAKMTALMEALDEGDGSGVYEGDAFADLRAQYDLPPRA